MKTPQKRFLLSGALVCSILTLGLDVSLAGPQPTAGKPHRIAPLRSAVPNTTFTDNVLIDTPATPLLELRQNISGGRPATDWIIQGDEFGFSIFDFTVATFPLSVDLGSPDASLTVRSNGNVGIGVPFVNAVQQALHVVRGDTPALRLEQDVSGGFAAQIWDVGANETGFGAFDVTANESRLFINNGGAVGLGTGSPAGKLHVFSPGNQLSIFQSSDNGAVQFRLQTDSTNRRFVALNSAGAQQSQLVFGDNGAFDFLGPTVGVVRMKILASGNVGIGTSAPTQLLSVNGTAGKPGGGSWATFSDERLKNIKGEFKSGLDEVMKLQPIRYEYKTDNAEGIKSEGEHIGFGAQEVRKIIPEAVTENADGYLMVDNDPILWTMLNAIKEQNAQMKAQDATWQARLDAQDREIAQLKAALARKSAARATH